ncbi:hypothetical protein DFJ77DRAFT_475149 [Powellomyces hirtus]|nr:hypothetical protein DFJ77DRAFT_475149 [Powellomyces hirtus]
MRKYIPLISGVLLPIATFLNTQSLIVPGWSYRERLSHGISDRPYEYYREHRPHWVYYRPSAVTALSFISLGFGLLGVGCLFFRMLEKKIKWCTRLIIMGATGQGFFALSAAICFWAWASRVEAQGAYTEGSFYAAICGLLSLAVAGLNSYHQYLNRLQIYSYTLYELSLAQRQLILLMITSIGYTFVMGSFYAKLEGWEPDDGVYWCITTLATIGFGDIVPKTLTGKLLLPLTASFGIGILAANIYAIRQVALELLTHRLASQYSKSFGIAKEFVGRELRHLENVVDRGVQRVGRTILGRGRPSSRRADTPRRVSIEESAVPQNIPSRRGGDCEQRTAFSAPGPCSTQRPDLLTRSDTDLLVPPVSNRYSAPARPVPDDDGVPFARAMTTSVLERSRTMIISRGANLPQLRIETDHHVRRHQVVEATRRTFREQIAIAVLAVLTNMCAFGAFFAFFEDWQFVEGLYFTFCSLTAIGYGDYVLRTVQSRSVFIWFLYIGIGSMTYMFSLMAERALDQWTVQVSKIENRVDRYERKAKLKKMYRKGDIWMEGKKRRKSTHHENISGDLLRPGVAVSPVTNVMHPSRISSNSSEYYTSDAMHSDEDDHRSRQFTNSETTSSSPGALSEGALLWPPELEHGITQSPMDEHAPELPAPSSRGDMVEEPMFDVEDIEEPEPSETTPLIDPSTSSSRSFSWIPSLREAAAAGASSSSTANNNATNNAPAVRFRSPLTHSRTASMGHNASLMDLRSPDNNNKTISSSLSPTPARASNITPAPSSSYLHPGVPFSRHMSIDTTALGGAAPRGVVLLEPPPASLDARDHHSARLGLGRRASLSSTLLHTTTPQRHRFRRRRRAVERDDTYDDDFYDDDQDSEYEEQDGQLVGRPLRMFSGRTSGLARSSTGSLVQQLQQQQHQQQQQSPLSASSSSSLSALQRHQNGSLRDPSHVTSNNLGDPPGGGGGTDTNV